MSKKVLRAAIGGITAGAIIGAVNMAEGNFVESFQLGLMGVGLPTAASSLIVDALDTKGSYDDSTYKAIFSGTLAVGLMIATGAMPSTVDSQTVALIAICAAGVYVGEVIKV